MAYDERTTMWWLDVGVCGASSCDNPSHSVNSAKLIKKKNLISNSAVLGYKKLSGNRPLVGCKNKTAGERHNRTSDLESPSRELSDEHLRGRI
jgi:hypothetical protein